VTEVYAPFRLSIVVCTYNRCSLLRECLTRLAEQCESDSQSEVIVVDNNSVDETQRVARSFSDRFPWFRLVSEAEQGLAHARNRGWREAKAPYVAFIDDDARPCAGWVTAINRFSAAHPDIAAFGGPYRAFAASAVPDWFPRDYGSWDLGQETRALTGSEFLNGTNMVFQRAVLQALGGFDSTLGMRGSDVGYGEETELMMRLRTRGLRMFYSPDIVVEHAILEYKMRLTWLLASAYRSGRSGALFHQLPVTSGWMRHSARLLAACVHGVWILLASGERYPQTRLYRALSPLMWQIGYFVALLRQPNARRH